MNGKAMKVCIRSSKTDQLSRGLILTVHATERPLCAVRAMEKYLQLRAQLGQPNALLLLFSNNPVFTRRATSRCLKNSLREHPEASRYTTRSFRNRTIHNCRSKPYANR